MTTVTHEEIRGGVFDYGGEPAAPAGVRLRVVQFFDDGTSREIVRPAVMGDLFAEWDSALAAQRDALATSAGAKATEAQELASALELAAEAARLAEARASDAEQRAAAAEQRLAALLEAMPVQ